MSSRVKRMSVSWRSQGSETTARSTLMSMRSKAATNSGRAGGRVRILRASLGNSRSILSSESFRISSSAVSTFSRVSRHSLALISWKAAWERAPSSTLTRHGVVDVEPKPPLVGRAGALCGAFATVSASFVKEPLRTRD